MKVKIKNSEESSYDNSDELEMDSRWKQRI